MRVTLEGNDKNELTTIMEAISSEYIKEVIAKDKATRNSRMADLIKLRDANETVLQDMRARIRRLAEVLGSPDPNSVGLKEKYIEEEIGLCRREVRSLHNQIINDETEIKTLELRIASLDKLPISKDSIVVAVQKNPDYQKLIQQKQKLQTTLKG